MTPLKLFIAACFVLWLVIASVVMVQSRSTAPIPFSAPTTGVTPAVKSAPPEIERIAQEFSPEKFAASLTELESAIKRKEWRLKNALLNERRLELDPVLKSSRGTTKPILVLKDRLEGQDTLLRAKLKEASS